MFIRIVKNESETLDENDLDLPDLEAAFNLLESLLGAIEDLIQEGPLAWRKLDDGVREDLEAWFNRTPDAADKQRLAELYNDGRFEAWDCPHDGCGTRVFWAAPLSWGDFQGARNADYVSFPGDTEKYTEKYLRKLCDHCRMKA
jgi:hypothetical protein